MSFLFAASVYIGLSVGFMLFKTVTTILSIRQRSSLSWLYRDDYVPSVSIIVPAYNEDEHSLRLCLESCLLNDYPFKTVYCVNDGSTNDTSKFLGDLKKEFPALVVLDLKKNVGKKEAMYKAIKKSRDEVLVMVDSDTIIKDGDSIRELVKPLYDIRVDGVSGKTFAYNENDNVLTRMQAGRYALAFEMEKAGQSSYGGVTCLPGCFSAYRRTAVLAVVKSWLDHTVFGVKTPYGDDRSLTRLILLNGGLVRYSSDAVAFTTVPGGVKGFVKQQVRWKRSFFSEHYFLVKNIGKLPFMAKVDLVWFLSVWCGGFIARGFTIAGLLLGHLSVHAGVLMYVAFALVHYTYVLLRYPGSRGLYGTAYGITNDLVLELPLASYAVCTLKEKGWGTR